MRSREAGFTLSEIIVAVAVIAILAGVMTPMVIKQIEKSRVSSATQELRSIKLGFEQYFADTARWPCNWSANNNGDQHHTLRDYNCLFERDSRHQGWNGPYLSENAGQRNGEVVAAQRDGDNNWFGVTDPWGEPYRIFKRKSGTNNAPLGTVVLYSYGSDNRRDTGDNDLLQGRASDDDIVLIVTQTAGG